MKIILLFYAVDHKLWANMSCSVYCKFDAAEALFQSTITLLAFGYDHVGNFLYFWAEFSWIPSLSRFAEMIFSVQLLQAAFCPSIRPTLRFM